MSCRFPASLVLLVEGYYRIGCGVDVVMVCVSVLCAEIVLFPQKCDLASGRHDLLLTIATLV